jgi:iron(III) transport system substrate-binding protein
MRHYKFAIILIMWAAPAFSLTVESVTSYGPEKQVADLRILSSTDRDIFEPVLKRFVQEFSQIQIKYTVASTSDIFTEISENHAKFDLVMSSAMDLQIKLANDGLASSLDLGENLGIPDWSIWQDQLVSFSAEPIVMVLSKKDFASKKAPKTRREIISLIRNDPDFFRQRVITYDVNSSGAGFLFASQDARQSDSFWRLAEVFGGVKAKLVCCSGDMLHEIESGKSVLAYNLIGSYAEQHAKTMKNIQIVYPKDYTLVLLRSALIPLNADNKQSAKQFLTYLLAKDGQAHMARTTGLLSIKSQSALDQGNFKPIRLDTGLLVNLDKLKRKRFLREWNEALVQ